jgi:hypothetical protein
MSESCVLRIFIDDKPQPGIRRLLGLARTEHGLVEFCWILSPLVLLLRVEPNKAGLSLIKETEDVLGAPSLRYCNTKGNYKDYNAEWHPKHDRTVTAHRLSELTAGRLGYKATEIPEEIERK